MLSLAVLAAAAHLSQRVGNTLTENDPFGRDRLAATLAAADVAADAAGRVRAQIRETYLRKFAEASAAVQTGTLDSLGKGARSHKALRLLATAPNSAEKASPEIVPWHQNRHKDLNTPAKANNATKKQVVASTVLKRRGMALVAPRPTKGSNGAKAKAEANPKASARRKGGTVVKGGKALYEVPMLKVANMAVAAAKKESVLRKKASEEVVKAESLAKTKTQKAENMLAKVEAARELKAIADLKSKKAEAVQAKKRRANAAVKAAALKKERKQEAARKAEEAGEAEAEQEAHAKAQTLAASLAKKRILELSKKKKKGQHKAAEKRAIKAMEIAIKTPIKAELMVAEKERRAEEKAKAKVMAKNAAKEKRKTNELRVSLDEAQKMMLAKEQEEAVKQAAEQEAKVAAEEEATATPEEEVAAQPAPATVSQLRERPATSATPQAVGVSGCRSMNGDQALDKWCGNNCKVGFCPAETCTCATKSKRRKR
jgi:hypothetical protein